MNGHNRNASRFNTDLAFVRAEEFCRDSDEFERQRAEAESSGANKFVVEVRLEPIFGAGYQQKVTGFSRTGTRRAPTGTIPTDFTDGTVLAVYYKGDGIGEWFLETMYAEPKGPRISNDGTILSYVLRNLCNFEARELRWLEDIRSFLEHEEGRARQFARELDVAIEQRTLSCSAYKALTHEDFDTDEDVVEWLQGLRAMLFE